MPICRDVSARAPLCAPPREEPCQELKPVTMETSRLLGLAKSSGGRTLAQATVVAPGCRSGARECQTSFLKGRLVALRRVLSDWRSEEDSECFQCGGGVDESAAADAADQIRGWRAGGGDCLLHLGAGRLRRSSDNFSKTSKTRLPTSLMPVRESSPRRTRRTGTITNAACPDANAPLLGSS